jgi:hypothetical protein
MIEPKIIIGDTIGRHNEDLDKSIQRIEKSKAYRDLSTIIISPTRGMFPTRVVQSWMKLIKPSNQKVAGPIFAEGIEVGKAYNILIKTILENSLLNNFKYILTIEEDNMPPPDGLIKLYENMDEYDVVGGLYWAKGESGFPMIFGDPKDKGTYIPQTPKKGELQEANALGMGFNLFKLDMFKSIPEPWFETYQHYNKETGSAEQYTQDIFFYKKASEYGFKFAVDNRISVGHFDVKTGIVW